MKIQLLLILALLFTFSFDASAINSVAIDSEANTTLNITGEKQNVFTKAGTWFKKQQNKAVAFVVKKAMAIDWNDERTILKYWIIALIAAVLLSVLSGVIAVTVGGIAGTLLYAVSSLLWLAGVILFWYWIYLKFIK
jgi:hypothetical protein